MIAHSQPIALPAPNAHSDYPMHTSDGSGSFNPASFTRHFLGSPISWRASSWGMNSSRFPAGSPTAQLLSSIDFGKTPPSMESDSLMNALNVFEREGELCRNYTCCGLQLHDLHALLEHFEDVHIVVVEQQQGSAAQAHIQIPFHPTVSELPQQQQQQYPTPFDPDEMELDFDLDNHPPPPPPTITAPPPSRASPASLPPSSAAPSPPDTPISTPVSAYSSSAMPINGHYVSAPPSPFGLSAYTSSAAPSTAASTRQNSPSPSVSSPEATSSSLAPSTASGSRPALSALTFPRTLFPAGFSAGFSGPGGYSSSRTNGGNATPIHPEDAFNAYARFASDYSSSMPGAQFNGATVDEASAWGLQSPPAVDSSSEECVPPALLFAGLQSPKNSKKAPTQPANHQLSANMNRSPSSSSSSASLASPISSTSSAAIPSSSSTAAALSRPATSLLMSKPFRCPKPNCNKSYKQANGLKYHMTHGSCNFAPPKDLEHVKDLLEQKRKEREAAANAAGGSGQVQQAGPSLVRSASLGSAPTNSSPLAHSASASSSTQAQTRPGTPLSPASILSLTADDLAQISESELAEVEREAERRLRPFACGVGECTRRYKNMNGLRYHYQHSGDHGAVGLALLASGMHECLGGRRGQGSSATASARMGGGPGGKGSISVPVSRAGSVSVNASRVGTPVSAHGHHAPTAFMPAPSYGQQQHAVQMHAQGQHQAYPSHAAYPLPPMTLGMGLAPLGSTSSSSSSSSSANATGNSSSSNTTAASLKTTAITPTTAPVQAQAFAVPHGTAQSALQAQFAAHAHQHHQHPHAQRTQSHSPPHAAQAPTQQGQTHQQQYAAAYQHYATQAQQRYGGLGLGVVGLGMGAGVGANAGGSAPASPVSGHGSPVQAGQGGMEVHDRPRQQMQQHGGQEHQHQQGLGQTTQEARLLLRVREEQDAGRAAALYARQQHQQAAAGMGMGMGDGMEM